jgi:hypothetical protein
LCKAAILAISDLHGLWRRSLIVWPDGRRDDTTTVTWLQGPNFYADLRTPAQRPDFAGVASRQDLTREQVTWLATQEGFAGLLTFDGQFFEWHRALDFQPRSATADAGRLWLEEGRMIEQGRDIPYIEHWHRDDTEQRVPCGAIRIRESQTGCEGLLVRAGSYFMYARERALALPRGGSLAECVAAASLEDARALVDCEISFGHIGASGWIIDASSLPDRQGANLRPAIAGGRAQFGTADVAASGEFYVRTWAITMSEGDLGLTYELPPISRTPR